MLVRFAALATLVTLAGCPGRDQGAPAPKAAVEAAAQRPDQVIGGNVIPQSHTVPAGHAAEIRRLFESGALSYPIAVVSSGGAQTQFVQPKPVFVGDTRFVVGAPPQVHAAIDQLIAGMDKTPATSTTYELTFWVVEAVASAEPEVPRDLADVGPMLTKLDALGKRKFKEIDRVSGRSRDGAQTKLTGRLMKVEHKLMTTPDGLELQMDLQMLGVGDKPDSTFAPYLETTLQLPLDKPIVIGDTAQAAASDGAANLLLYVVRARRVD